MQEAFQNVRRRLMGTSSWIDSVHLNNEFRINHFEFCGYGGIYKYFSREMIFVSCPISGALVPLSAEDKLQIAAAGRTDCYKTERLSRDDGLEWQFILQV